DTSGASMQTTSQSECIHYLRQSVDVDAGANRADRFQRVIISTLGRALQLQKTIFLGDFNASSPVEGEPGTDRNPLQSRQIVELKRQKFERGERAKFYGRDELLIPSQRHTFANLGVFDAEIALKIRGHRRRRAVC